MCTMDTCGLSIIQHTCKAFFHNYSTQSRIDSPDGPEWSCNVSSYCLMYTVCSCRWVSECISVPFTLGCSPFVASRVSSRHSQAAWLAFCRWWTVLQFSEYCCTLLHWQARQFPQNVFALSLTCTFQKVCFFLKSKEPVISHSSKLIMCRFNSMHQC